MLTTPQPAQQSQAGGEPCEGQSQPPEGALAGAGLALRDGGEHLFAHVAVTRVAAGGIDGKYGLGHATQHIATARGRAGQTAAVSISQVVSGEPRLTQNPTPLGRK